MGKVKFSDSSHLRQYVSDFKDGLTSDGKVLFCQACGKSVVAQQRSQVIAQLKQKDRLGRQSLIGESSTTSSSSGTSKFAIFATSVQSICVRRHTTF
jgi:hypothetical protein